MSDPVNHPEWYKIGNIETIDFITAKKLCYELGNVVKYVSRAQYKGRYLEDLKKAKWYLDYKIKKLEEVRAIEIQQYGEGVREELENAVQE